MILNIEEFPFEKMDGNCDEIIWSDMKFTCLEYKFLYKFIFAPLTDIYFLDLQKIQINKVKQLEIMKQKFNPNKYIISNQIYPLVVNYITITPFWHIVENKDSLIFTKDCNLLYKKIELINQLS